MTIISSIINASFNEILKDLIEAGVYDTTNYSHSECMKFVFTTFVQRELFVISDTWNSHRIRNTNTTDAIIRSAGRADVIYFTYSNKYLHLVNHQDIELLYNNLEQGHIGKSYACWTEFFELANILMNENSVNQATNAQEGLNLFTKLCQIFCALLFKRIILTLTKFLPIRPFKTIKFCLDLIWQTVFH